MSVKSYDWWVGVCGEYGDRAATHDKTVQTERYYLAEDDLCWLAGVNSAAVERNCAGVHQRCWLTAHGQEGACSVVAGPLGWPPNWMLMMESIPGVRRPGTLSMGMV